MLHPMFASSLSSLPLIQNARSRTINCENPTGEPGRGGMAASHLGPSRKGSPCFTLKAGETATLAEMSGPGAINHIWITVTDKTSDADCFVLRDVILRMYWDGEETPSVECPLGDFFASGFGVGARVNSLPIVVNPNRGFNCYFQMPFAKKAKITVESQHANDIGGFFYQVDYVLYDDPLPENTAYFHAQWRRQRCTTRQQDYVLLDGVTGRGHYVGTYLALTTLERYWWGEGEMKFYIDDDGDYPTICGTGTEDYFGGAWSFADQVDGRTVEQTYCTPFMGYPYHSRDDMAVHNRYHEADTPPQRGFYRWHIMDPIHFRSHLRVTLQQIGVGHRGLFERSDDVASVAYWYQAEPHAAFPPLMEKEDRWPR